jgi:hypothetical protein
MHGLGAAGFIAMIVGALDPLEGSVLIVLGSALVALALYLVRAERRLVSYWTTVFVLIAVGVAAMWGLSAVGGFGGRSGRSLWWGVLLLPYLAGWIMAVWGPGSPRWFSWLTMAIGLLWMALPTVGLVRRGTTGPGPLVWAGFALALLGLATVAGSAVRLRRRVA